MRLRLISPPYRAGEQFFVPYGMAIVNRYMAQFMPTSQIDLDMTINQLNKSRLTPKKIVNTGLFNDFFKFEDYLLNNKINKNLEKLLSKIVELLRIQQDEIMAFSVHCSSQLFFALSIAKKIREVRNNKIIFGGAFFYVSDKEKIFSMCKFIDILAVGRIDEVSQELITALKQNKRKIIISKKKSNQFITPDYEGLSIQEYGRIINGKKELILPVQTSLGCHNKCCFCFFCKKTWFYNLNEIIKSIKYQKKKYGNRFFYMVNLNINIREFPLEKFLQRIIDEKLDIKWYSRCMVNRLNENIIKKMKKAGCISLEIGLETASPKLQKTMNKNINIDDFEYKIKLLKKYGIQVVLNLITGLPGENNKDFEMTLNFIRKNSKYIDYLNVRRFCAFPGSAIFANPQKFGITIPKLQNPITQLWGNYDFVYDNPINVKKRKKQLLRTYYFHILRRKFKYLNLVPFNVFYYLYFKKYLFKNSFLNYIYIKFTNNKQTLWRN